MSVIKKSIVVILVFLTIIPFISVTAIYVDPNVSNALDKNRFIDPNDLLYNKIIPGKYIDPKDYTPYIPFSSINGVKSNLGDVNLYSSDGSIQITSDYIGSKINFISNVSSVSGSDNNKVAVSSSDTNPNYLFSKLQAGSGITLSIQNPGSDENILISSTGASGDGNGSILGTANQISVTNGLSRLFGDSNVVLSLPQNIHTAATPQFVGLTLSPCSSLTVDSSPQIRFKVDCIGLLNTSQTIIPSQSAISDLGNITNIWDDLWVIDANVRNDLNAGHLKANNARILNLSVDDLNASCDDLNDNCLTESDGNDLYVRLNGAGIQTIISTGLTTIRTSGHVTPATSGTGGLGQAGFRWGSSFINQITTNPGNGGAGMFVQVNTSSFCGVSTDICMDFNNTTKSFNFTDMNIMYYGWGIGSNAIGLSYQIPRATDGSWDDYQRDGSYQNMIVGTQLAPQVYYEGKFNHVGSNQIDLNVTDDLNVTGDGNFHNNLYVDQNIYGQLGFGVALIGTTCNTICTAYNNTPLGSTWTCILATSQAGVASTCGDTLIEKNCVCKN